MKINVTRTKMSHDEWQRRLDEKIMRQFKKNLEAHHVHYIRFIFSSNSNIRELGVIVKKDNRSLMDELDEMPQPLGAFIFGIIVVGGSIAIVIVGLLVIITIIHAITWLSTVL